MKVTKVYLDRDVKKDLNNYIGEVSVIFDYDFKVTEIKLMDGKQGMYLLFPSDKRNKGIAYPVNNEIRVEILNEVLKLLEEDINE